MQKIYLQISIEKELLAQKREKVALKGKKNKLSIQSCANNLNYF